MEYYTFIDCCGRWGLRHMSETDESSQANAECTGHFYILILLKKHDTLLL